MSLSHSRVTLEINIGAIRRNYRRIRDHVAPLKVMAVLKANAYGLGVRAIAKALQEEGIHAFGVAEPKEAEALEDLGIPVLILGGLLPDEIPELVRQQAWIPIQSLETAELVQAAAKQQGKIAKCHLLIDTGMGRLGFNKKTCIDRVLQIRQLPNLQVDGIYSHFPTAYSDRAFSESQIDTLLEIVSRLDKEYGITIPHLHISNSDGIHNIPKATQSPFTMVRTGINLYGCFDLEGRQTLKLEEAICIRSKLVSVRELPAGSSIGYGRTCILDKPTLVGTVSIGYADGLPLYFSETGYLIVNGQKCAILGRTSMDYTTIDLSSVPESRVGDIVICLGKGITTTHWARAKGTIPYEVICSIGNRVERLVVEN